jgi:hypothetical protein
MAVIGRLLGVNWFSKLITSLLLIGESAIPIYLVFDRRLKKLGQQLFDRTLQLRLGRAAPAGEMPPPSHTHTHTSDMLGVLVKLKLDRAAIAGELRPPHYHTDTPLIIHQGCLHGC